MVYNMGFIKRFVYFTIVLYVLTSILLKETEARRKILKGRKTITRDYIKPPLLPAWLSTVFIGMGFLLVGGILYAALSKFVIVSPSSSMMYASDNEV